MRWFMNAKIEISGWRLQVKAINIGRPSGI